MANLAQQTQKPTFAVRQFRDEDHAAVGAIFTDSFPLLQDEAQIAAYIQSALDGDLADVSGVYVTPGGNFWVATATTDDTKEPEVVGMVALEKKANGDGELRRMFVKQKLRGFGVGKLLVRELEQWAKTNGYKTVSLSTGEATPGSQRFYTALGYEKVGEHQFPEMPNVLLFDYVKHL